MTKPIQEIQADCREIRRSILWASRHSGHGHIPTSFSVVELLYAVYSSMRHNPQRPDWSERDIFILSKGHASLGLYSTLARFGYFDTERLKTFGAHGSMFGCHADRLKVPGVEASTGSLGHGIGLAVGMALANKIRQTPRKIYTLIGDGEANEGTVWEAVMVASNLKLDNLTILYDDNKSQIRSLQIYDAAARFRSFGCDVVEVPGHDVPAIVAGLNQPAGTVKIIVASTVKGYGCPTLANNIFEWHRKSPSDDTQYQMLVEELNAQTIS